MTQYRLFITHWCNNLRLAGKTTCTDKITQFNNCGMCQVFIQQVTVYNWPKYDAAYQVHSHVKKELSCANALETHGITNLSNLLLELFVKGLSFFYVPLHQKKHYQVFICWTGYMYWHFRASFRWGQIHVPSPPPAWFRQRIREIIQQNLQKSPFLKI